MRNAPTSLCNKTGILISCNNSARLEGQKILNEEDRRWNYGVSGIILSIKQICRSVLPPQYAWYVLWQYSAYSYMLQPHVWQHSIAMLAIVAVIAGNWQKICLSVSLQHRQLLVSLNGRHEKRRGRADTVRGNFGRCWKCCVSGA